jgi:hypothetical protein
VEDVEAEVHHGLRRVQREDLRDWSIKRRRFANR